ncbi:MAG TPA: hypothetical protein PLE99_17035 [Candidatus Thiothrix moscowensis]|uniref:hypothetical protein n=1 Tax=unclassified Thiothrix TaxID=2636184 RepID=UPI001A1A2A44|nr:MULTISPECIES: hypothetical protein [unclassified Thiothrix]MBJ6610762.1 hypothetical protein [Candidatus Thiothrix moscowensis]HRJ54469.1 hypothetical protein [Candidatus Thiothrix moscowensis]HRJ94830.1 hypothetical protein [Candidatus Thiothrix moscowensis]
MNIKLQENALPSTNGAVEPIMSQGLQELGSRIDWTQVWKVTRAVLVVWAVAVWALLILMPGVEQISDVDSATLHLPYMLIGLVLVGAVTAAHSLKADGHLLWFLGVLLMLAGWM